MTSTKFQINHKFKISNSKLSLYCIIPAYNEEKNIIGVIKSVKPYVDEIVVVDDGSSDTTFEKANECSVTVLRHIINRGQGAALQTGNEYAIKNGADIIIHFDADGQFLADELKDIYRPLINNECDVVFGSRFLEKKSKLPALKKYVIFPLARIINSLLFKINLTDPQCGFRGLNRKATSRISIENDGAAHCSEIIYKVFKEKLLVKEVPVSVKYNDFGQAIFSGKGRGTGGLKIIIDLLIYKLIKP